jgi:excisionase family DNA binding protein
MYGNGEKVLSDWITTKEAAELSGYHPVYLRELIRNGKIKAQKFGETWQVDRHSLLAFMKESENKGEKRGPKKSRS